MPRSFRRWLEATVSEMHARDGMVTLLAERSASRERDILRQTLFPLRWKLEGAWALLLDLS